jgi:KOW motif
MEIHRLCIVDPSSHTRRSEAPTLGILVAMPTSLHEGDQALILGGPFAGKVGTITRLDSESATVVCDVFDRDTPVNVGLDDVTSPSPGTSGDREPHFPLPSAGSPGAVADQD